jgi:hypothetical protein
MSDSPAASIVIQNDPRREYARRLELRRMSVAAAIGRHVRFGNMRAGAFALIAVVVYAALARDLFSAWWLLAPAAAFLWVTVQLDRAISARTRLERAAGFYERALARLDGQWAGSAIDTGERFLDEAHLYARDLDVFGPASLFERLNSARTRMGEDTLAAWLKTPAAPGTIGARQAALADLAPRLDLREDMAVLGEDTRAGVHPEALAAWGEQSSRLPSPSLPWWAWPLSIAGVAAAGGLVALLMEGVGALPLEPRAHAAVRLGVLAVVALCGFVVWRTHARVAGIFHQADHAARDLALLAGVLARIECERFSTARLAALRAELDVDGDPPSRRIARLHVLIGLVDSRHHLLIRIIGPLVLWDVHLAYALERWRRTSGPAVRRWLAAVGELEALSSLAGYHYERPADVFPKLADGPPIFAAHQLGHPLIPDAAMIPNDVTLDSDARVLVVSGSNMSGKSTLLRSVGINAVLALAGAPVCARTLRMTPLSIGASIYVQDSLHAGVSRFYAEITRLGLIMQRAADRPPMLFLIDELLHGTNSHDRRIGAEAIVRGLVDRGAIGLLTTHDLALTHVADAPGTRATNVHFQDTLEDGRMHFDYRMRPGVVQKSNALALMRSVGLDV